MRSPDCGSMLTAWDTAFSYNPTAGNKSSNTFGPDFVLYAELMTAACRALPVLIITATVICGPFARAADPDWHQRALDRLAVIRGTDKVPGLHHSVRVQRDRWGVAHIYAGDQHDLFFAQGFVAAQDRLFQMELWKRAGQGRLAEILGPSAVQRDLNARRLRYRGDMAQEYRSYSPDTLEILQAFTAGINAYIADIRRAGHPGLPLEFQLARFAPEQRNPEDCPTRLAASAMMDNASDEPLHAKLVPLLGADQASK